MHIILLSMALMFSVSVRTPKEQPNPLDYEVATGLEIGKKSSAEIETWYERDNGVIWTGLDTKGKLRYKRLENSAFFTHRQAQDMLRGGLASNVVVLKYGRLGVSNIWDHMEPATCGNLGLQTPYLSACVRIYEEGMESCEATLRFPYRVSTWLTIELLGKYRRDRQDKKFMQVKAALKLERQADDK